MFVRMVYDTPLMSVREVQQAQRPEEKAVHVLYTDKNSFKSHAKALGLMDDLKVSIFNLMMLLCSSGRCFKTFSHCSSRLFY